LLLQAEDIARRIVPKPIGGVGSYFGSVANCGAFHRDVAAGHYHIAPVSYNRDFNQEIDADLAPGQQLYVKILALSKLGRRLSRLCPRHVLRLADACYRRFHDVIEEPITSWTDQVAIVT